MPEALAGLGNLLDLGVRERKERVSGKRAREENVCKRQEEEVESEEAQSQK